MGGISGIYHIRSILILHLFIEKMIQENKKVPSLATFDFKSIKILAGFFIKINQVSPTEL